MTALEMRDCLAETVYSKCDNDDYVFNVLDREIVSGEIAKELNCKRKPITRALNKKRVSRKWVRGKLIETGMCPNCADELLTDLIKQFQSYKAFWDNSKYFCLSLRIMRSAKVRCLSEQLGQNFYDSVINEVRWKFMVKEEGWEV